jgi:6-phosphofructokinase 1
VNIGVLTSGGDAPGMNAAVRAVVRQGLAGGHRLVGFRHGFDGILKADYVELHPGSVGGIIDEGGTFLGTGRSPRFELEEGQLAALENLAALDVDGLLVVGGEGSMKGAHALCLRGFPALGIPGTIDNDVYGTEVSIGFDTCLNTILDAVSKLRDTASAHDRVFVVEVMGRKCGALALYSALGGGADFVVIPEDLSHRDQAARAVAYDHRRGKLHTIILVAEGACTADEMVKALSGNVLGHEVRRSVLGYIQRGGHPSARDRILGSRMGAAATDALVGGTSDVMVGVEADRIVFTALEDVITKKKELDLSILDLLATLAL